MKPEIKYKLIEKLIQTEDDALLSQVQEILEDSSSKSEDLKQELDKRMEKYRRGESSLYTWEEVKKHVKKK
ncbi:addiction module protein [Cytophagaceae bacterium ABcell3]|nr:addiction module protein [Cytophagaceae bacterium ABcell3]